MRRSLPLLLVPFLLAPALLLHGCGGRTAPSGVATGVAADRGVAKVTVAWPDRPVAGRVVPLASNSIVVQIKDASGTVKAHTTLARPATTWTSPQLTAGDYTLVATAYPTTSGTGTAEAAGTGTVTIIAKTTVALGDVALVLSGAAKTALASGATHAQLAQIGFARPAKPVRPKALTGPTNLVANGFEDGTVKIAWDRNGNSQGATFEIFGSADGLDYAMVATTTRASLVLEGYAPGAACWFKVRATRSGLTSPLSNAAPVYAPGAPSAVRLRVA